MKWFKLYGSEYLSDTKILSLTSEERSCWITLLCHASTNDNDNDNGKVKYLTEYQLMVQSGIEPRDECWGKTEGVLKRFKKLGMIRIANGVITVKNWDKRQEMSLTGYERVKRYREKVKNETNDNTGDNTLITSEEEGEEEGEEEVDTEKNNILTDFDTFWKAYPRKEGKRPAQKSWKSLNPSKELVKSILEDLELRKKSEQWEDKKFIPHPATYLNQKRWEDEDKHAERKKKEYYQGLEIRRLEGGVIKVLTKDGGPWIEFAGKEEDIMLK